MSRRDKEAKQKGKGFLNIIQNRKIIFIFFWGHNGKVTAYFL